MSDNPLTALYQKACDIDWQAFKPGNVSQYAEGHGMTCSDFKISAEVSAPAICNRSLSLGEKIYFAVKATREVVGCNTNLGIILLCAPLLEAYFGIKPQESLRQALTRILETTTVDDANWTFKAIALANPGGLGTDRQQDVNSEATVTLTAAMRIAAGRDRIAQQYINAYKDIFEIATLSYNAGFDRFGDENWAAVCVYADLLSRFSDSHIERKFGHKYSDLIIRKMTRLSKELAKVDHPENLKPMLYELDGEFKVLGINPGTTADLVVATVLAFFLEDLISKTELY